MSYRQTIATLAIGSCLIISSAMATPMPGRTENAISSDAMLVQYSQCPPGYKATSHGGCKMTDYLRRHPKQQDYYNNAQPRYNYHPSRRRNYNYDDNRYYRNDGYRDDGYRDDEY